MNDLLKIVADYADQLATAEELADSDTMTVAAALDELYEARGWVAEWEDRERIAELGRLLSELADLMEVSAGVCRAIVDRIFPRGGAA